MFSVNEIRAGVIKKSNWEVTQDFVNEQRSEDVKKKFQPYVGKKVSTITFSDGKKTEWKTLCLQDQSTDIDVWQQGVMTIKFFPDKK